VREDNKKCELYSKGSVDYKNEKNEKRNVRKGRKNVREDLGFEERETRRAKTVKDDKNEIEKSSVREEFW
jgi:hypothetical protein